MAVVDAEVGAFDVAVDAKVLYDFECVFGSGFARTDLRVFAGVKAFVFELESANFEAIAKVELIFEARLELIGNAREFNGAKFPSVF